MVGGAHISVAFVVLVIKTDLFSVNTASFHGKYCPANLSNGEQQ
jgi:hypothetical protein